MSNRAYAQAVPPPVVYAAELPAAPVIPRTQWAGYNIVQWEGRRYVDASQGRNTALFETSAQSAFGFQLQRKSVQRIIVVALAVLAAAAVIAATIATGGFVGTAIVAGLATAFVVGGVGFLSIHCANDYDASSLVNDRRKELASREALTDPRKRRLLTDAEAVQRFTNTTSTDPQQLLAAYQLLELTGVSRPRELGNLERLSQETAQLHRNLAARVAPHEARRDRAIRAALNAEHSAHLRAGVAALGADVVAPHSTLGDVVKLGAGAYAAHASGRAAGAEDAARATFDSAAVMERLNMGFDQKLTFLRTEARVCLRSISDELRAAEAQGRISTLLQNDGAHRAVARRA